MENKQEDFESLPKSFSSHTPGSPWASGEWTSSSEDYNQLQNNGSSPKKNTKTEPLTSMPCSCTERKSTSGVNVTLTSTDITGTTRPAETSTRASVTARKRMRPLSPTDSARTEIISPRHEEEITKELWTPSWNYTPRTTSYTKRQWRPTSRPWVPWRQFRSSRWLTSNPWTPQVGRWTNRPYSYGGPQGQGRQPWPQRWWGRGTYW